MDLEQVSYLAYGLRGGRTRVQDLHGPWATDGPCWPTPYGQPFGSPAFDAALNGSPGGAPVCRWEHGRLVQVADEAILTALTGEWEPWRLAGASVGPVDPCPVTEQDQRLIRAFCSRGWQRLLVRAFHHVGCKAAHVGCTGAEVPHGLGADIEAARRRPRLAVLEEALVQRAMDPAGLFGLLDETDRALDAHGMGESWAMKQVPAHVLSLWPMRNLLRMSDRFGALFRDQEWKDYEGSNVYAPEVPILVVEEGIYGGGIEHDVTHFVSPVLWTEDQLCFELGNNGIEGDGQAMNNLILASRHQGPAYEGFAGWPGADLFEWLERSFQVATIPEQIAALRTFTIVLHRQFNGDPHETLRALAPELNAGAELADLLHFYPEYVQHDHDFLGELHPRYLTPFYRQWREVLGDRVLEDPWELVDVANDLLWALEDLDLRSWDVLCRGEASHLVQRQQVLLTKTLELQHLCELRWPEDGDPVQDCVKDLAARALEQRRDIREWCEGLLGAMESMPGPAAPPGAEEAVLGWGRALGRFEEDLRGVAGDLREAQRHWPEGLPRIPEGFTRAPTELFEGYYFVSPTHVGSDTSEPQTLKGCYSGV